MTTIAPGGALHEAPPRPRALLPGFGPLRPVLRPVLGPVVNPVRPVLGPVVRAALPPSMRTRPLLPPAPRPARPLQQPVRPPVPTPGPVQPHALPPALLAPASAPVPVPPDPASAASRRRQLVLAGAGGLVVAAGAALLSPLGAVSGVEVHGVSARWAGAVGAAASADVGSRALLLDTGQVARRVEALPGVRSARVSVRWPGTLVVDVDERVAAAAVPVAGGVHLVGADGVDLGPATALPPGLPVVVLGDGPGAEAARVDAAEVAAALAVRAELPPALAAEVLTAGATSRDGVWLALRGGVRVVWGGAGEAGAKSEALAALRAAAPQAATYDVSSPDAAAVSSS